MPHKKRIVAPGSSDRTVRTGDGQVLHAPADWELLPPSDATLTRRVKAAGPTWTVQEKKGRKTFSRGVWAPAARIAAVRGELDAKRSIDACVRRRAADTARRDRKQSEYVEKQVRRSHWLLVLALGMVSSGLRGAEPGWRGLADPVVEDGWVRPPAEKVAAKPVWGLAKGLRVGIAPLPGPRGLLRVYTPYVGQPDWRMINFIAIEPIVEGRTHRSFSELERSSLAEGTGKVMWSADRRDAWTPQNPAHPARGVIGEDNGVRTLTVFIGVEKFHSGAAVFLRLTFREDRPCEVRIATFTQPYSEPLSYCIVTATMGNYARLRRLHLADGVVAAHELFADATFNAIGFAPHKQFRLERLPRTRDGAVILAATSDERDPATADQTTVAPGWRYVGRPATQYWRCDQPDRELKALVNARRTYWASNNPIPGGVSFENVELTAPFQSGQTWTFGVTTDPPTALLRPERVPDAMKN